MKKSSCPRPGEKLGPIDMVRPHLATFEFEVLSLLLHHWAMAEPSTGRGLELADKLPVFRAAVISGKGGREKGAPGELVTAEYRIVHHAIRWLRENRPRRSSLGKRAEWLEQVKVPYIFQALGEESTFERPVPIVAGTLERVSKDLVGRYRPSEIAHKVTAERLGCSAKKVKNAVSVKGKKRITVSPSHGLLISVFLDLCSQADEEQPFDLLARILATLFSAGCHVLAIYYMIQRAHALKEKLYVGHYDLSQIEELCDAVCPEVRHLNYRPFVRLIAGR